MRVDRIDSTYFDYYGHLSGPCPFTSKHLEQGDVIGNAGTSGNSTGIHLHYHKQNSAGVTQPICLSGLCNFSESTYHNDWFISDNAGPGLNPWDGDVWDQIRWRYAVGHFGGNAWDRFGSSIDIGDGYFIALPYSFAGDRGWRQEFREPPSQGSDWNDFARPDVCDKAYVIPEDYYSSYIFYANQLGQPRSENEAGTFFPWFQKFRWGIMWSTQYGTSPNIILNSPTTTCS